MTLNISKFTKQNSSLAKNTPRSTNRFGVAAAITACVGSLAASLSGTSPARAESFPIIEGGGYAILDVENLRDRKFATTIRQQFDFSCGSAAVATLLTYHYDQPTSETDAFRSMWDVGDQARIQEVGFSLLEMKNYLKSLGYRADGFRLSLDRIQEIGVPGIALVDIQGYKHFVIIKGITKDKVLFGDPSRGISARSRADFEEIWDGTILFVRSHVEIGRANFNSVQDWRVAPGGPTDRGVDRKETLAQDNLQQTRTLFSGFNLNTQVQTLAPGQ